MPGTSNVAITIGSPPLGGPTDRRSTSSMPSTECAWSRLKEIHAGNLPGMGTAYPPAQKPETPRENSRLWCPPRILHGWTMNTPSWEVGRLWKLPYTVTSSVPHPVRLHSVPQQPGA